MDPFSGRQSRQQPVTRETAAPAARPEPASVAEVPAYTPRSHTTPHHASTKKPSRRGLLLIVAAIVIITALAAISQLMSGSALPGVDSGKYQAVFLKDKYVYIGKLSDAGNGYYRLTTVFYPQAADGTDAKASDTQLVKLGNDLLGASDEMMIAKSQVISYENLKDDGQAAKAIQAYLKKK